jgi:hypothetical protein
VVSFLQRKDTLLIEIAKRPDVNRASFNQGNGSLLVRWRNLAFSRGRVVTLWRRCQSFFMFISLILRLKPDEIQA